MDVNTLAEAGGYKLRQIIGYEDKDFPGGSVCPISAHKRVTDLLRFFRLDSRKHVTVSSSDELVRLISGQFGRDTEGELC